MVQPRPRPRARALRHLLVIAVLAAAVGTGLGPISHPADVRAGTADDMEAQLLTLINNARTTRGLVPLRKWTTLADMAGDRAATMAKNRTLAHASCLSCLFNSYGVQWYGIGEVIAASTYPWGSQAASSIFNAWKASSTHWAILMSSRFNYIGLGVALSSTGKTYAAGEVSESNDHTLPWAKITSVARAGSSVYWYWSGADTKLQTHTSGLKNFDVQYRVDGGTWSTIRSGTTATSLSLGSRAGEHYYGIRIRSRDNRGYLSAWTAEKRIWVP
jgi:uncharacterized protein YkwD